MTQDFMVHYLHSNAYFFYYIARVLIYASILSMWQDVRYDDWLGPHFSSITEEQSFSEPAIQIKLVDFDIMQFAITGTV